MRVSFIGCPCSGKTTAAVMTVARLKTAGIPCEFIVEQARVYIAEKRFKMKLQPHDKLELTDLDQLYIMMRQLEMETIMSTVAGPDLIVVSDSSPLNSLFYMTEEGRACAEVEELTKKAVESVDLIFYAAPIQGLSLFDPNRVHDEKQSLAVDEQILPILKKVAPQIVDRIIPLAGNPEYCLSLVFEAITTKMFS